MPSDLTVMDALLKDVWAPSIENQLVTKFPILQKFERVKDYMWDGRQVIQPVLLGRTGAVMATAERARHPNAGNMRPGRFFIPIRFVHGQIQVSGPLIELTRTNEGAFARGLKIEMDGLVGALGLHGAYYLWHDGRGVRALVNEATPSGNTALIVDTPGGVTTSNTVATNGARFLNAGDFLSFISPTGILRAGGTRQIAAGGVSADGTTVTLTAAPNAAVANNDFIVKAYGNDATIVIENTEWQHPPMGLLGMVDNGGYVQNFHGLSRATETILQSTVVTVNGALSADIIQRGLDTSSALGGTISELWMDHATRRAFLQLTEGGRRYQGGDLLRPDAGTAAAKQGTMTFGDLPIHTDAFAPYQTAFGLDFSTMERYEPVPGEWVANDGRTLRKVANEDSFEGTYRKYCNNHCNSPIKNVRWDGITSNIVVVHIN